MIRLASKARTAWTTRLARATWAILAHVGLSVRSVASVAFFAFPARRAFLARLACLALLVASGAATACGHKGDDASRENIVTPVRVRQVEERSQLAGARYSGTVEPGTRVDLAFKVGGYVRELAQVKSGSDTRRVQEGDWVTKDMILAVLRESDYQQRVAAAQAQLAEAIAVEKQAQLDFERTQKLVATNAVAKVELDTQNARLATGRARVEGGRSQVREAEIQLADCTLRAPLDGVILKRSIEVGTLVSPGTVAYVLADTKTVKVIFGAPDRLMEKLKRGGNMTVEFDAIPGDFVGVISRIAPSADPKSRAFEVEVTIPNADDRIKVGMIAKLVVGEAALSAQTLVLPLTAVVRSPHDPRGFSVFVVVAEGGKEIAHLREVKLGEVVGNVVIVSEGLKALDRVVSMGATLLTDGDAVRIIPD